MKAVLLKAYGGIDQLSYEDVPTPKPGSGEVLVKVAATSVNPIDWKMRSGVAKERFPVDFPGILGRDVAGEVAEVGPGVTGFTIGQRVMALTTQSYAEYAVVKADSLAPVPDALSFEEAAALPLILLTGAQLIERGVKPKAGQSVLVTGALGSVGRVAAYVAGQHQAQVIAGVKASQLAEAEGLGTPALVALEDEKAMLAFKDLDAVADTVNGPTAARTLKHLRKGGVFATVTQVPKEAKDFEIQTERVTCQPDASRLYQLAEEVARKHLNIPIAKVMRLSEAGKAQEVGEAGGAGGKIVLVV